MNFAVYTKPGCPYCEKVLKVLDLAGFDHEVYKLYKHYSEEEFFEKFGEGATFPQVLLDEVKLGGCTDTIKYLREHKHI